MFVRNTGIPLDSLNYQIDFNWTEPDSFESAAAIPCISDISVNNIRSAHYSSQGTLDLLILRIVALGPIHGYALAQRIQQVSREALVRQKKEFGRASPGLLTQVRKHANLGHP
jgi:hypothetical protein